MLRMLLHWILNAIALLVVSHFVQGFAVQTRPHRKFRRNG